MTTTEPNTDAPELPGVPVTIDGVEIRADKGELLIAAAERHGVHIPHFCYHPRMNPVGMCRMCLVEVDTGRGPGLQPSCMLPVTDGMVVNTETDVVKKAQDGVLEFLLINHPLDCPVCDKGGECPLQDQTMAYGPGESRFVEEKRHFEKPIPISDLVHLDRERCILCDRCTRFASEVAGDPLIHFQARGNQTEVNTFPDEPFSSYFSGNTVQICPVGALTARPYRFKARPWDLSEIASTATTDSMGARITVQSSRDEVLRYLGVDSDPVNWGWLSDKERFSFEAWNSDRRVTAPLMRGDSLGAVDADGDDLVEASWARALVAAAEMLEEVDPARIGVLGGARMSNESQYAWAKFVKGSLGTDNVDCQLGDGVAPSLALGLSRSTIDQACAAGGTVLVVGVDPKETHGSLFLRLRHAAMHDKATLLEINHRSSGLTPYAAESALAAPGQLVAMVADLSQSAPEIGAALAAAESPTIVFGEGSLGSSPVEVSAVVSVLAAAYPSARFLPLPHRGNVMGALDMGLAPGLLPGRRSLGAAPDSWSTTPTSVGLDAEGILRAASSGDLDVLILLGADPASDFRDADLASAALDEASVIAVDCLLNESSMQADVVFPAAATATEIDGTFTNVEGRVSPIARKVTSPGTARPDWMIAVEIAAQLGTDLGFIDVAELWEDLTSASPLHADLSAEALAAAGPNGIVLTGGEIEPGSEWAPSADGAEGLRLFIARKMYDDGTMLQAAPSQAGLAAGASASMNPADFDTLGVERGATVEVSSARGSITIPAIPDPGVPVGCVAVEANQPGPTLRALVDASADVTTVTVEAAR
ncbi:MAG: NADH-quinone oxidoreductase subunit NuoG [Acidimicrobiales bacterium]